jgi:hypothetical protein
LKDHCDNERSIEGGLAQPSARLHQHPVTFGSQKWVSEMAKEVSATFGIAGDRHGREMGRMWVALDGSSQTRVTVTVTTTPGAAAAGFVGPPPAGSARLKWLLMLLLTALAVACLQRARLRQTVLGCLIALVVFSGMSGCGSNGSTAATAPGTYPFTLQATSGKTIRNTLLTLVVK